MDDLIAAYGDGGRRAAAPQPPPPSGAAPSTQLAVVAAPRVAPRAGGGRLTASSAYAVSGALVVAGPHHPQLDAARGAGASRAQPVAFEHAAFQDAQRAANKRLRGARPRAGAKRARGDPGSVDDNPVAYLGPWAEYAGAKTKQVITPELEAYMREAKRRKRIKDGLDPDAPSDDGGEGNDAAADAAVGASASGAAAEAEPVAAEPALEAAAGPSSTPAPAEVSTFYGDALFDYQGRSWLAPPAGVKASALDLVAKVPSKCHYTWSSGSDKGFSKIQLFPGTGHLLLAASLDGPAGVKDINFNHDGSSFLTASYDSTVKVWDTETGACIRTYALGDGVHPNCARWQPNPTIDPSSFLAALSSSRIEQFDVRADSPAFTQEYKEHLSAVHGICFVEGGKRFVSTGDDKAVRAWEWGIPVQISNVREPHMHAMPTMALHPKGKHLAGQCLNNQILKRFMGHNNAGYALHLAFSPDGSMLSSGDASGKLWFWDWGHSRIIKSFKAHSDVLVDVAWHPLNPSWMFTASWDGTVKFWK
ncbi:pre-mRNA-processing factor 17 [Thecamonas trahens ATCC 50062]|uniref:Pre-mRNA-processing factor 17 n=1 Tax=Thecamonas trahens ATCC 50062 TaxID=461836 RepID=A0A0L0DV13_THETB|nr:pre-mRNA-processing factor 17 [Thecamonas trahens ATCC 50062]KNC55921.1 pre-mRNA-processing factor 17 [Thecamonas trahens ATCC 50062]|eukprot:XP_013752739.1 pre-mRNA-processing factor 17 [Thecamonas trahens ATCC 50062]